MTVQQTKLKHLERNLSFIRASNKTSGFSDSAFLLFEAMDVNLHFRNSSFGVDYELKQKGKIGCRQRTPKNIELYYVCFLCDSYPLFCCILILFPFFGLCFELFLFPFSCFLISFLLFFVFCFLSFGECGMDKGIGFEKPLSWFSMPSFNYISYLSPMVAHIEDSLHAIRWDSFLTADKEKQESYLGTVSCNSCKLYNVLPVKFARSRFL